MIVVASAAVRALGWLLIAIGIIAFIYAFAGGLAKGHIGSKESFTGDAAAIILGWFSLLIGPALAFGETPVAIRKKVEAGR